jgi:hypothetical protein
MKKFFLFFFSAAVFVSCTKEVSLENGGTASGLNIIGNDCRISKITYSDNASGVALGSISANINASDKATDITDFDSLNNTLNSFTTLQYRNDTVDISANEYFILNPTTKRVIHFHGLIDPTNPFSLQIETDYVYNASVQLIQKNYSLTIQPGVTYAKVDYTYTGANLTRMVSTELLSGVVTDADMQYSSSLAPKNFIYIFPDENNFQEFTQFLNFGARPSNAITSMKVRNYDPTTGIILDSAVSSFSNYELSVDKYVLNCLMTGDDQVSIPAVAGRLRFSYKCK